jgi:hypothetical protein
MREENLLEPMVGDPAIRLQPVWNRSAVYQVDRCGKSKSSVLIRFAYWSTRRFFASSGPVAGFIKSAAATK